MLVGKTWITILTSLTIHAILNKPPHFYLSKITLWENQVGGVGRHTAPPRTTRTDRKSNGKEVRHQGNKK